MKKDLCHTRTGVKYLLMLCPQLALASGLMSSVDPITPVIFWIIILFSVGTLGRFIAIRMNLAGVLGELIIGIVFGNIGYYLGIPVVTLLREGPQVFQTSSMDDFLKIAYVIDIFSRFGILFLLFMVGLESSLKDLKHTGRASIQVALIGVIAPMLLSILVTSYLIPTLTSSGHIFIAATLAATSVGITARVLKEMNKLRTREAHTILGAAIIDDILGLLLLAIVSNIALHQIIDLQSIGVILLSTLLFFVGVFTIGPWIFKTFFRFFHAFDLFEATLAIVFLMLMIFSWLASIIHLAPIIGAFLAGLVTHEYFENKKSLDIKALIAPLEVLLAPLFFILIGIQVRLETLVHFKVIYLAIALILAAILGKLLSGLGGNKKDDRLLIGIGMLPRGEVGLIFAAVGKSLNIISNEVFSAIVLMVIITTLIAPSWLKLRYSKHASS